MYANSLKYLFMFLFIGNERATLIESIYHSFWYWNKVERKSIMKDNS